MIEIVSTLSIMAIRLRQPLDCDSRLFRSFERNRFEGDLEVVFYFPPNALILNLKQ